MRDSKKKAFLPYIKSKCRDFHLFCKDSWYNSSKTLARRSILRFGFPKKNSENFSSFLFFFLRTISWTIKMIKMKHLFNGTCHLCCVFRIFLQKVFSLLLGSKTESWKSHFPPRLTVYFSTYFSPFATKTFHSIWPKSNRFSHRMTTEFERLFLSWKTCFCWPMLIHFLLNGFSMTLHNRKGRLSDFHGDYHVIGIL